jgi:hypothetical protein
VCECSQGEKVLLIYDYITSFEEKKGGFALLKARETALIAHVQAEKRGKWYLIFRLFVLCHD